MCFAVLHIRRRRSHSAIRVRLWSVYVCVVAPVSTGPGPPRPPIGPLGLPAAMADSRLSSQKREAEEQVQELSRQIRALHQKKRRLSARTKTEAEFPRSPSSQRVVLIHRISGQAADVTSDYVRGLGQPRCTAVELTAEQVQTILKDVTAATERYAAGAPRISEAALAARYVMEHRWYAWVLEQNCVFGVAPSRAQLVQQALLGVPTDLSADVKQIVQLGLTATARTQRKWLARFRARWGARLGILKTEDSVSVAEARQKAWVLR